MIQFKYYSTIWDRNEKKNTDTFQMMNIEELKLQVRTKVVESCNKIYKAYMQSGEEDVLTLYKNKKKELTAIDSHSVNSFLSDEWQSSNVLCYDYDKLTTEEITAIITKISDNCFFHMVSPSGHGIKIFFCFDNITKENFKGLYEAFGSKLNDKLGHKYDTACKDYVRLCFLTDSIVVCNDDERDCYKVADYYTAPLRWAIKGIATQTFTIDYESIESIFNDCYNQMISNNVEIKDDYQQWTQELLLSIKYIVRGNDELGLQYFIAFSKLDKGFKSEEECIKVYKSFNSFKGSSIRYFVNYMFRYGIIINDDLLKKLRSSFSFWYEDEKDKLQIELIEVENLMKAKFFRINNRKEIYYKDGNILKLAHDFENDNEHIYYQILESYFEEILTDLNVDFNLKFAIIKLIKNKYSTIEFKKITLENKDLEAIYKRDTKKEIYLYTIGGLITITKDETTFKEYGIDDIVDEGWLVRGNTQGVSNYINYSPVDWKQYKSLPFYKKFCETKEDFAYLKRIIGYMINTNREYNKNFGVLFIDGKETEDNGGGGSGKSIVCKNFQFIRKTLKFNKPNFNSFIWSSFKNHNIINLEDMFWKNFSIRELRGFYDLEFIIEKKGKNMESIPENYVPRVICSSNYTPDSMDNADVRRWNIFTPSRFFHKDNTVEDFLGFKMFDYTPDEWNYWLSFIIECCREYLADDLKPLNKWDYITDKKNNELEGTKIFMDIKEYVLDLLTPAHNIGLEVFIPYSDLTSDIIKLDKITQTVKGYIKAVADEAGYNVEEKKVLTRKVPSHYQKKGFFFTIK